MEGVWTDTQYNRLWQMVIIGNEGFFLVTIDNEEIKTDGNITWFPKKGEFNFNHVKYIVRKGGNILKEKNSDFEFKKVYSPSTLNPYSPPVSSEDGFAVLEITLNKLTSNSSYTICEGNIKNTGKKTYKYVKVKGSFTDADKNVIDTAWTYAVGSEGLAPNESTKFELSVKKDRKIMWCGISLLEFESE